MIRRYFVILNKEEIDIQTYDLELTFIPQSVRFSFPSCDIRISSYSFRDSSLSETTQVQSLSPSHNQSNVTRPSITRMLRRPSILSGLLHLNKSNIVSHT